MSEWFKKNIRGLGNTYMNGGNTVAAIEPKEPGILDSFGSALSNIANSLEENMENNPMYNDPNLMGFADRVLSANPNDLVGDNNTYAGSLVNAGVGGAAGVFGGIADLLGADTLGNRMHAIAEATRDKNEIPADLDWDYITSPHGLARSTGNMLGSMAAIAPAAAFLPESAALGITSGIARLGGNRVVQSLVDHGFTNLAKQVSTRLPMAVQWSSTMIPESLAEGGNVVRSAREQGLDDPYIRGWKTAAENAPGLFASKLLEGLTLGGAFMPKPGAGILRKGATIPLTAGAEGIQNAGEEAYQQAVQNLNTDRPLGEGVKEAAAEGFWGSLLLGGLGGAANATGNHVNFEDTQEYKDWANGAAGNQDYSNIDLSDVPMQDIEDDGLAATNNTLKANFRNLFDWAKDAFGKEVEVSGGARSAEHNAEVNGSPTSHHLNGNAIDVNVSMLSDDEREAFIQKAKEMGFNSDGDDFYHDRGSGYHVHLTYMDNGNSAGTGQREGHENAWAIYDVFRQAGYNDNAIAGILGRVQQEHNFDTSNVEEYDDEQGRHLGGYGMFQWNGGRTTDFLAWAQDNNLDPQSPTVQAQYALLEAQQRGITPEKMNSLSAEDAADVWTKEWEVGEPGEERTYAGEWLGRIKNGGGVSPGTKGTSTPKTPKAESYQELESMYEGFAKELIETSQNPEDIDYFNDFFDSKGKFQGTKENLEKIRERTEGDLADEFKDYAERQKAKQESQKAQVAPDAPKIETEADNLNALEERLNAMKEDAVKNGDFDTATKINTALKTGDLAAMQSLAGVKLENVLNTPENTQAVQPSTQAQPVQQTQSAGQPGRFQNSSSRRWRSDEFSPTSLDGGRKVWIASTIKGRDLADSYTPEQISRIEEEAKKYNGELIQYHGNTLLGFKTPEDSKNFRDEMNRQTNNGNQEHPMFQASQPVQTPQPTQTAQAVQPQSTQAQQQTNPVPTQPQQAAIPAQPAQSQGQAQSAPNKTIEERDNDIINKAYENGMAPVAGTKPERRKQGKGLIRVASAAGLNLPSNLQNGLRNGSKKAIAEAQDIVRRDIPNIEALGGIRNENPESTETTPQESTSNAENQNQNAEFGQTPEAQVTATGNASPVPTQAKKEPKALAKFRENVAKVVDDYRKDKISYEDAARKIFAMDTQAENGAPDEDTRQAIRQVAEEGINQLNAIYEEKEAGTPSQTAQDSAGEAKTSGQEGEPTQEEKSAQNEPEPTQATVEENLKVETASNERGEKSAQNAVVAENASTDNKTELHFADLEKAMKASGRNVLIRALEKGYKPVGDNTLEAPDGTRYVLNDKAYNTFEKDYQNRQGKENPAPEDYSSMTLEELKAERQKQIDEEVARWNRNPGGKGTNNQLIYSEYDTVTGKPTGDVVGRTSESNNPEWYQWAYKRAGNKKPAKRDYPMYADEYLRNIQEYDELVREIERREAEAKQEEDVSVSAETKQETASYADRKAGLKKEFEDTAQQGNVDKAAEVIQNYINKEVAFAKSDMDKLANMPELGVDLDAYATGFDNTHTTIENVMTPGALSAFDGDQKRQLKGRVRDAVEAARAELERYKNSLSRQEKPAEAENNTVSTTEDFVSDRFGSEQEATERLLESFGKKQKKFVNVLDDSDEALEKALAEFDSELKKMSANPMFNPKLMMAAFKVGGIYLQRGVNKFADWAQQMTNTRKEMKPFLPAVWSALQSFPADTELNEKQMTDMFSFVGNQYDKGISKADIKKRVASLLGEGYDSFVDSAYAGVEKYPSADELKALREGENNGKGGKAGESDGGRTAGESRHTSGTGTVSQATARGEESIPERASSRPSSGDGVEAVAAEDDEALEEAGDTGGLRAGVSGTQGRQKDEAATGGLGRSGRERGGESVPSSVGRGRREDGGRAGEGGQGSAGVPASPDGANDTGTNQGVGKADRRDLVNENYHMENPDALLGGTAKVRFARNRKAIEIFRDLQASKRQPTQEEKDAMASYTGWGSFAQELFQGDYENPKPQKGWEKESQWMRDNLTKEEWESARESTINAHYTSPVVLQAMWDMAQRMGFNGGRVLEPSMGVGNFFALMPKGIESNSKLFGVEMDSLTGGISKMLYPKANIKVAPYQNVRVADGTYDLVIGNVPFANIAPADRRYDKFNATLHDYFFLKGIDELRAGGLMMAITSKGTMDKIHRDVRMELARKAELVDAYRLPTGAFKEYAGTDVVTDILVFRKRENPVLDVSKEEWLGTTEQDTGVKNYKEGRNYILNINNFFMNHPEKVLGTMGFGRASGHGPGLAVTMDAEKFQSQLDRMAKSVPEKVYEEPHYDKNISYISNASEDRIGTLQDVKGSLYVAMGVESKPIKEAAEWAFAKNLSEKTRAARIEELKDLVKLRKAYAALETAEKSDAKDMEKLRKKLKDTYDAHVAKYCFEKGKRKTVTRKGEKVPMLLEDTPGMRMFFKAGEPNYFSLAALENKKGDPAAILTERVMRSAKKDIANPTVKEALMIQRNKSMRIDIDEIAKLSKKSKEEVLDELKDYIFKNPNGEYQAKDQYLSGNVRRKLREAQTALENGDREMERNIEALKKVIPDDIPYYNINVGFGGTWIDIPYYKQFIAELVGNADVGKINVTRNVNGAWKVKFDDKSYNGTAGATTAYGTNDVRFDVLLTHALNHTKPRITYKDSDGNTHVNEEAMQKAVEQMDKIRETFSSWVWKDENRKTELAHSYNEALNNTAKPSYDGSFLDMVGMMLKRGEKAFNLRKHQINAIYRGLVNGSGIYAHEVGTGKTYTMGGLALESRRFGLARKPLILAHNANSASVAKEIQEMYPGAKICYISGDKKSVKRDIMRVKNDDWDVVVMPHSKVDKLTLTEETLNALAADIIAQLEDDAEEAARAEGINLNNIDIDDEKEVNKIRSQTVKELVKQRIKVKENILKNAYKASDEDAIPFEDLGIDMIIADESHMFKKPPFSTKMTVKGLQKDSSMRSIQFNFLTQYVQGQNNGRGVHLFTGTPITNTITEMFHNMRYVMPNVMKEADVYQFDDWFNAFAQIDTKLEYASTGEPELVDRLNSFVNLTELRRMVGQYMDIVFADDMPEFEPRKTKSGKTLASKDLTEEERDYLINGRDEDAVGRPYMQTINEVIPMNDAQKGILEKFIGYARTWRDASKLVRKKIMKGSLPQSPLFTMQSIHKAAMDARIYNKAINTSGMDSKEARVVSNIMKIYNSDPRTTQVIMMETGMNDVSKDVIKRDENDNPVIGIGDDKFVRWNAPTYNLQAGIKKLLIEQGIPEKEIAVVNGGTSAKVKAEIAEKVAMGQIRVVFGSTDTLGTGVNMQDNLKAIHHVDAPWMPGELEQRNGRILRQGNKWNTVYEYRYITEKLDGRRWQILATKQKFIKAFLTAADNLRVLDGDAVDMSDGEDNTAGSGDLEETLSKATGDPRFMQKANLEQKVERLEKAYSNFTSGIEEAKFKLKSLKDGRLDELKDMVSRLKGVRDKYTAYKQNTSGFHITIGGKTYDDQDAANDAIASIVSNAGKVDKEFKIGEYAGLNLYGVKESHEGTTGRYYEYKIRITDSDRTIPGFDCKNSTGGIIQKLSRLDSSIEKAEESLKRAENDVKTLEKQVKETFPREKELATRKKQLSDIEKDLMENPVPPPSWLIEGAPLQSDVLVDGKKGTVEGYKATPEGDFYVKVKEEGKDNTRIYPWQDVKDTQGLPMITAPEGVGESRPADEIEYKTPEDSAEEKPSVNRKYSLDNSDNRRYSVDKEDVVSEVFERVKQPKYLRLIKDNLNYEEVVERLLEPENIAVSRALSLYEIRERNNDSTTIPRMRLKEALQAADIRRRALKDERGRKTLDDVLRQRGRLREGSNLERTLSGRDIERVRLSDGTYPESGRDVKIPGEFGSLYEHDIVKELLQEIRDESADTKRNSIRPTSRSNESGFSIARSMDELKAEAKEAFPGAKGQESGNKLIFTMPNGQKVTFTFHESITVSDEELSRAKREHGIDQRVTVTVEGYAESVDGEGFGALSQGSREGTGFHEAYHIAEAIAFTKKELADAKRLISENEEERANAYAKWKLSRQKHSNFAKLWQKIADVAAKMAGILGYETKRNLFRKVESGEIYKRDNTAKDTEKKYSVNSSEGSSEQSFLARATDALAKKMGVKPTSDRVKVDERPSRDKGFKPVIDYIFSSPSRIAERNKSFKLFYNMADKAMNLLTKNRTEFNRKFDKAWSLCKSQDERNTLNEVLVTGDAEEKEYTKDEILAMGGTENVAEAYKQIRSLIRKSYNLVNEARKRPTPHSRRLTNDEINKLRENPFVDIQKISDAEDGKKLVTYKEYANWTKEYDVTPDELQQFENDKAIQILEQDENEDGTIHLKVREGISDLANKKGYVPHVFHEYMVRVKDEEGNIVDDYGYGGVIASGRNESEAIVKAEEWLKNNNLKDGETIHVAPKVFSFQSLGMDEGQYAAVMGDKDFNRMVEGIAEHNEISLAEAKELVKGSAKKKNRHRFFGHTLQRHGAKGYEQDMQWALRHYFNSAVRYHAMETEFKPQAISLFERLFGDFDKKHTGLAKYVQDYISDINGNPSELEQTINEFLNQSAVWRKLVVSRYGDRAALRAVNSVTRTMSYLCLGFINTSSALLNFSQTINAAAYLGNPKYAPMIIANGMKRKYTQQEMKVLIETNVGNDIGLDSGSGYDRMRSFGGLWNAIGDKGMILFKKSERCCRFGATLVAYKKARANGKTHDQAVAYAKEINRKSNFDYSVADAPNIFRRGSIISQVALQFKKYGIKEMEVVADMFPTSSKTTKAQKAIFWGMYLLTAGLLQVPLFNWWDKLFGGKDAIQKYIMEATGDSPFARQLAITAMYGISANAGIDMSRRVGLADVIPSEGRNLVPPAINKPISFAQDMAAGNYANAVRDFSPGLYNQYAAWIAGESEGGRGRTNSVYNDMYSKILRSAGFTSTDERIASDIQRITYNQKDEKAKEKQQAIDEFIENPTNENAKRLKELGVKPSTVKKERERKKRSKLDRIKVDMSKEEMKRNKDLFRFAE